MIAEQTLIANCQKGDKKSQYLLVKKYSPLMLSICRRYARDQNMAKDILQESLILIFKHISKFKGEGSFEGWIRKITVRASLQWIDKKWYRNEQNLVVIPDEKEIHPDAYMNHDADLIMDMVNDLPEKYRIVFNLYVVDEYNHAEIAENLEIKEATSRSHLLRARKMLQEKYLTLYKKKDIRKAFL